jgi:hypothetical protein
MGGHYFAYLRPFRPAGEERKWYRFDDARVEAADEAEVRERSFGDEEGKRCVSVPSAAPIHDQSDVTSRSASSAYMLMYRLVDARNIGAVSEAAVPAEFKPGGTAESDDEDDMPPQRRNSPSYGPGLPPPAPSGIDPVTFHYFPDHARQTLVPHVDADAKVPNAPAPVLSVTVFTARCRTLPSRSRCTARPCSRWRTAPSPCSRSTSRAEHATLSASGARRQAPCRCWPLHCAAGRRKFDHYYKKRGFTLGARRSEALEQRAYAPTHVMLETREEVPLSRRRPGCPPLIAATVA